MKLIRYIKSLYFNWKAKRIFKKNCLPEVEYKPTETATGRFIDTGGEDYKQALMNVAKLVDDNVIVKYLERIKDFESEEQNNKRKECAIQAFRDEYDRKANELLTNYVNKAEKRYIESMQKYYKVIRSRGNKPKTK